MKINDLTMDNMSFGTEKICGTINFGFGEVENMYPEMTEELDENPYVLDIKIEYLAAQETTGTEVEEEFFYSLNMMRARNFIIGPIRASLFLILNRKGLRHAES